MPNLAFMAPAKTRLATLWDKIKPYTKATLDIATERNTVLTVFQCVCAFSVLFGISYFSVPAALIVGGLGGILVAERQQRG
jgi:hypothetical protein